MNASFDWKRLWFRTDARASLLDGYLPEGQQPFSVPGPLGVKLGELRDTPCLILLGTPGMGKTTEIQKEAEEARQRAEAVTFLSLSELSAPDDLATALNRSSESAKSAIETSYWNIFLDGLDEVLSDSSQIEKAISQQLRLLAQNGLLGKVRFRISCRTAEWPSALEAELRTLWAGDEVAVVQLERLRQEDVEKAARQVLGDNIAVKFIQQIDNYDAEPLASRPVTLRMLLNIFQQQTDFPRQQQELYRRGLLAFIQEGNLARRQNRQTWRLDVTSKLIVAGRIAAAALLSDSSDVWTGLYADMPSSRTVAIADIAGGHEPSLGSSFPVDEAELKEVLLTSLFLPVSEERFVFAHKTFSEFLAAYYLNQHELSSDDLIELLQTSEETKIIPPQLREVSAWLAGMHPDFFRKLARSQPDILLRSDVASSSTEDRAMFVEQLMLAFEHEEIHDFDYQLRRRYSRLWHPTLADQIRPYISSKETGLVARRVAIDIAQENKLTELAQLLLQISLDKTENHHIRGQAVAAIAEFKIPAITVQLLPLAIENNPEDVNDDLKGWSLRALFPEYISTQQLLRTISPEKQGNYIGPYHMFLSYLKLHNVRQTDAVELVQWAAAQIDERDEASVFERIIPHLLEQIWKLANDEKILEAFVNFFQTVGSTHKYLSLGRHFGNFIAEIKKSSARRRRLIAEILGRQEPDGTKTPLPLALHTGLSLFTEDDLIWLVDELTSRASKIPDTSLIDLIVSNTYGKEIDALAWIWECATSFPELEQKLSQAYSVNLDSSNAKWLREDQDRRNEKLARTQPTPEFDAVNALRSGLERIERGDIAYWWELNLVFFAEIDGALNADKELASNLAKLPLWEAISQVDRYRIIEAAHRYVIEYRPRSSWLGKNVFHRPAAAGYRAFRLIQAEAPELLRDFGEKHWSKWAPAIIAPTFDYSEDEAAAHTALACECYRVAPTQVYRVLRRILTNDLSQYAARRATTLFSGCYDEDFGTFVYDFLSMSSTSELHAERNRELLTFLIRKNYSVAVELTVAALVKGCPLEGTLIATAKDFAVAVSALLDQRPHSVCRAFLELTTSNEELAKGVMYELAQSWRLDRSDFGEGYSENDLGDLGIWLFRTFPDREEKQGGRARWVSSVDRIEEFRGGLVRFLVTKGTKASVAAIEKIASAISDRPWLRYQVLDARRAMSANTWRRRTPTEIIKFIGLIKPPSVFKSTKAIIVEAAQAFQSANMGSEDRPTILEKPAETLDLSPPPKRGGDGVTSTQVLAVATEWKSKHGGITTLNREMCVSMSELGHEVVCVVIESTEAEKADAASRGVTLIDAPNYPTIRGEYRLHFLSRRTFRGFEPRIVIGHDHKTGAAGLYLAKEIFEVPYVHFVHTLPEGAEQHKTRNSRNILDGSRKADAQKQLCILSDLVVCVGPLLHRTMQTALQNYEIPVVEFRPGLDKHLLAKKNDTAKILAIYCLFMARLEDGILKGADIACHVIAALNKKWQWDRYKSPRLIMRGFEEETIDRDLASLGDIQHAKRYVMPRGYTPNASDIADDICMSSVIIMPSRVEAFGLVALEAIAAGVPVLVTSSSGVGELLTILTTESPGSQSLAADACVVDVVESDIEATIEQWSAKAQAIIANPVAAFAAADKLRSKLLPILSWENAARKLSNDIEAILVTHRRRPEALPNARSG
jgi:glycosyltransferase involved in cell wall biosynthesis